MFTLDVTVSISYKIGVDGGGLARDMISAFWEEAYSNMFDGALVVVQLCIQKPHLLTLPQLIISFSTHFWLVVFCQYA